MDCAHEKPPHGEHPHYPRTIEILLAAGDYINSMRIKLEKINIPFDLERIVSFICNGFVMFSL